MTPTPSHVDYSPSTSILHSGFLAARTVVEASTTTVSNSILAREHALQQLRSVNTQRRYVSVANTQGEFNGTCESTLSNVPLDAQEGQCASYYPDVTSYCCAAVGGILQEIEVENSTETQPNSTVLEPVCETTNYADMLDCYKYIAETHCRSAVVGPWGVCHPAPDKVDTSRSIQHSSASSTFSPVSPSTAAYVTICLCLFYSIAGVLLVQ